MGNRLFKKVKRILICISVFLCIMLINFNTLVLAEGTLLITQQPSAFSCGDGDQAVYRIKASGSGNRYQWQFSMDNGKTWKNSGDAGNKTEMLTFTARQSYNGLLLRCVVTNGSKTVTSKTAKLNVLKKEDWELPIM